MSAWGFGGDWMKLTRVPVPALEEGAHTFLVRLFNGGSGPNPSGLLALIELDAADGTTRTIRSGSGAWSGVDALPDGAWPPTEARPEFVDSGCARRDRRSLRW